MSEDTSAFTIDEDSNGRIAPDDDLVIDELLEDHDHKDLLIEDLPENHDHKDLIIEDLPEDHYLEDQLEPQHSLPSVEEAKANLPNQKAGNLKKICLIVWAVLAVTALTVSGIVISVKNNDNNKEAVYEQPNGRIEQVMDFIFDNEVSTLPDLNDVYSAQHRAAGFIADGDAYQIELSEENAAKFVERYVLTLLYYQFNGPEWTYNYKFLSKRDHCEWWDTFESASGEELRQGVICNEDGYVVELNLAWNGLKGTHISREIGYLGQLEALHMYYNDIGGYFPDCFRYMPSLKGIGLMKTGLIGTLPDWIGEMTQLTTLGLGDNQMHGEVPESIKNLKNIKILGLDGNNGLTGSFNKFKSLSSLEALYLENNALTGSLDNFNWPKLVELDVSNNMLDGPIPNSLLRHPTLEVVDIHNNLIFGPFPDDILENNNLQYLTMHQNQISSTIPDRLAFLKNLKHLDLSFNVLTGTIPDTLTQLTELRYLASSGNRFDAQGLLDMRQMTNLMDLAMKGNNLNGKIPDWIGGLTSLQLLDLDANELSGTIPSWIGLLRDLDHLLLNRNKLTGTIPTQMENIYHLNVLLLDGNSLKGNADAVCESNKENPSFFVSDCYPGQNGERAEIECRCCTQCCTDDDPSCNDKKWTSNVDPIWEYGYVRPFYTFSLENAPSMYSKYGDGENYVEPLP